MEVKEAVRKALEYVSDTFSDAKLSNLGLEEVEYDDTNARWKVTVGFSRPWDYPQKSAIEAMSENPFTKPSRPISRTYKVVEIRDSDGKAIAIKMRELAVDE